MTRTNNLSTGRLVIYGLLDPDTEELRYVGKTYTLKYRVTAHKWVARRNLLERPVYKWLDDLEAAGKQPIVQVLCAFHQGGYAEIVANHGERALIRYLSYNNALLNVQHNLGNERKIRKTWAQQQVTCNGRTQSLAAWRRELGLTVEGFRQRLLKYPAEIAVSTPKGRGPVLKRRMLA